jgi:hypothetical protein
MAAVKTKLGRIPCDCCGHPAMLRVNEHKTLTISCDECDMSAFAKHGTGAATRWRAKLPPEAVPEPLPSRVPKAPEQKADDEQPVPVPDKVPKKATPFDPMAFFAKGSPA